MGTHRVEGGLGHRGLAPQHDSVALPLWSDRYRHVLVGAPRPSTIQVYVVSAPQVSVRVFDLVPSITVSLDCILVSLVVPDLCCMTVVIPFVQFPSESVES